MSIFILLRQPVTLYFQQEPNSFSIVNKKKLLKLGVGHKLFGVERKQVLKSTPGRQCNGCKWQSHSEEISFYLILVKHKFPIFQLLESLLLLSAYYLLLQSKHFQVNFS